MIKFLFQFQIRFKIKDINIPDIDGMFTSFEVGEKKTPLFVDQTGFTDTHHYARFMGYDKPIDFGFDNNNVVDKKAHKSVNE